MRKFVLLVFKTWILTSKPQNSNNKNTDASKSKNLPQFNTCTSNNTTSTQEKKENKEKNTEYKNDDERWKVGKWNV